MRGNGLEAMSYVAIADLDPRVADAMLEVFRDAGLAAYVEPCQQVSSLQLEVRVPTAPTDRLFVDEAELDRAKHLLDEQLPELRERAGLSEEQFEDDEPEGGGGVATAKQPEPVPGSGSQDAAWEELVQAYETSTDSPVPPWPVVEDTDEADADSGEKSDAGADAGAEQRTAESGQRKPVDPEGYVPPPPPPLPRLDPIAKGAWVALIGGPVMLILSTIVGAYVPWWFVPVGLVAFAGGFLTLVFRMRGGPPDESDDGAVV